MTFEKFFGGSAGCADAEPGTQVISLGIDENNDNIYDEVGVAEVQITLANMDLAATSLCKSGETHEGACNFRVFAGDSKVFLEDVQTDCGFPTYDDSTVKYLRLFREVVAANGSSTTPNALSTSDDFIISPTSSSCTTTKLANLNENTVDGLVNGTTYRFAVGLLDSANNLGGILDVSGESTDPDDNANCFTVDPDHPLNCHVATPDEVVGLIEKEFDCFITTATYGSAFRPKVEDFRKFRNAYLHTTWLGRKIIKFYYRHSPPIADWIRQHPQSKLVMRGILYPFWLFAKACLEFPILTILTLLLGLMGIGFGLKARGVRP